MPKYFGIDWAGKNMNDETPKKNPRINISVPLLPEELRQIKEAADASGMQIARWMRTVAMVAAGGKLRSQLDRLPK